MFLVVIAVLSIVLAFPRPVYLALTEAPALMLAAAGVAFVPVLVAALTSQRALRLLERHVTDPTYGQAALARGNMLVQATLGAGNAALLLLTGWQDLCNELPSVGQWPVVPSLLALTPFLVSLMLVWIALYPADRAIRQIALEVHLFRGRPVRPVWGLGEYLVYSLRHQLLFIFVPMLIILAARDVIFVYSRSLQAWAGSAYISDVLLGAAAVFVAVVAPELLRHIWSTRRLPNGPLRDRLQSLCRLAGVRCREILIWRAGGMIVNAAVMGVIAPLRYVLITDGMIEQLGDSRIEAVFGHEAGHVKRHHILFFLLFALISGCAVTIFSARTNHMATESIQFQVASVAIGLLLMLKWGVLFGWVSRRFERQADMYGVRTLTLAGLPCTGNCVLHDSANGSDGKNVSESSLCNAAAHLFSDTLHEVAVLNGMSPDARSWRHGSISLRSRTLLKYAADPKAAARAEWVVLQIKLAIFGVAVIASVWAAREVHLLHLLGIG